MEILSKYMNSHIPAFYDINLDLIIDICFKILIPLIIFRKIINQIQLKLNGPPVINIVLLSTSIILINI